LFKEKDRRIGRICPREMTHPRRRQRCSDSSCISINRDHIGYDLAARFTQYHDGFEAGTGAGDATVRCTGEIICENHHTSHSPTSRGAALSISSSLFCTRLYHHAVSGGSSRLVTTTLEATSIVAA